MSREVYKVTIVKIDDEGKKRDAKRARKRIEGTKRKRALAIWGVREQEETKRKNRVGGLGTGV